MCRGITKLAVAVCWVLHFIIRVSYSIQSESLGFRDVTTSATITVVCRKKKKTSVTAVKLNISAKVRY